jgi:acyl-CoA reductase-like NAD-dependent aldehyde dehydrogenase
MSIVVQKYGGSSVADVDRLRRVAARVVDTRRQGHQVCVVVSAMGETTDKLLGLAQAVSAAPSRRELDMLLSCGERISMALLSMAINDLGCEAISFTGSVPVGRSVREEATARDCRVQLELGGHNPLVVLADAELERAVEAAYAGAFWSAGQKCTATRRIFVQEEVYEAFRERLLARVAAGKVGDPADPEVEVGPVVNEGGLEDILAAIERAKGEAARFTSLVAEYERAPQVTRKRLYLDAMESVLSNTSKIVVDSKSGNQLLYLPVDQLMRQQDAPAGTNRPPAANVTPAPSGPAAAPAGEDYRGRGR